MSADRLVPRPPPASTACPTAAPGCINTPAAPAAGRLTRARCAWGSAIASCMLLATGPGVSHAQTAAQWQAEQIRASQQSEKIMLDANRRKGLLAQYQVMRYAYAGNRSPAFRVIFSQYLSWYQTFIGDYPDAAASFSIKQAAQADDRPSPLALHDTAEPALQAIAALARQRQAVFFNEAHNVPLTRTLTVQLLARLRAEGFDYFASETLYQTDTGLQARGYPVKASGFYTEEPIYAEMVRTALKLGFKVIAYEALSDATGNAREAEQARNIYRQVFKRDPKARLVVNAGYAHIQESGVYLDGQSMAEHLRRLTGIDPLTVEQTMLYPHASARDDHPYYTAVMQQLKPSQPIVFLDNSGKDKVGKPWSLRPGYDVSVFFPPQVMRRDRPTWLDLGGERLPYRVNGERCNHHYPCLVEARYTSEGSDAIPADRLALDPVPLNAVPSDRISNGLREPAGDLYLRPGTYHLSYTDADDQVQFQQDITVTPADAAPDSATAPDKPDQSRRLRPCAPAGALQAQWQGGYTHCLGERR